MPLSINGWLNGGTALLIVICGPIFGLILLNKARKSEESYLLVYTAFSGLCASLLWLGPATDFITILITGKNLNNSFGLYGILSYMWVGPSTLFGFYTGAYILTPNYKKVVLILMLILTLTFELVLFLFTPYIFEFTKPNGDNIIDSNFVPGSFAFYLMILILLGIFLYNGVGALMASIKTAGEIKKRFRYFSACYLTFTFVAVSDALLSPGPILFLIRILMVFCEISLYNSLKLDSFDSTLKKESISSKIPLDTSNGGEGLNTSLIETLLKSKPTKISAQEITLYREQKICLVCKGAVAGFNFICPKCEALYCESCVHALIDLENMCWVCNEPFDKSKQVKPYDKEIKEDKIEIGKDKPIK